MNALSELFYMVMSIQIALLLSSFRGQKESHMFRSASISTKSILGHKLLFGIDSDFRKVRIKDFQAFVVMHSILHVFLLPSLLFNVSYFYS